MLKGLFGKGALKGFGNWLKGALPNVLKDTAINMAIGKIFGGGNGGGGGGSAAELQATVQAGPAQDPSEMRKRLREVNAQYQNVKSERDREYRKLNLLETKIISDKNTNEPFPESNNNTTAEIDVNHVNPPSSNQGKTGYEEQLNDVTNLNNAVNELNYAKNQKQAYNDPDVNGARISKLESKVDKLDQEYRSKYMLSRADRVKKGMTEAANDMIPGVKIGYNDEATVRGFKVMNKELELLRIKQAETIINMQSALQAQGYAGGGGPAGGDSGGGGGMLSGLMGTIISGLMMDGAMTLGGKLLEKTGVTAWAGKQWTKLKNATGLNKLLGKGAQEAAEELGEKGAKQVAEKGTKAVADKAIKKSVQEAAKKGGKEAAEEAIEAAAKRKLGTEIAKRAGKEGVEELVAVGGKQVAKKGIVAAGGRLLTKIGGKLSQTVLGRIAKKIAAKAGQKLAVAATGPWGVAATVGMLAYDLWSLGSFIVETRTIISKFQSKEMDSNLWASLVSKNLTPEMQAENEWGPDELALIESLPEMFKKLTVLEASQFVMFLGAENLNALAKPIDLTSTDTIDEQMKAHEGGGDTRGFFTKLKDFGVRMFAPGTTTESQQIIEHQQKQKQQAQAQPQGDYGAGDYSSNFSGQLTFDGRGGSYSQAPDSKGNGYAQNRDLINYAAAAVGVDSGLLMRMSASESGFTPSIKHKEASAAGLFQFIDSTWNGVKKQYGKDYGIPMNAPSTDAKANALLGARFIKENLISRSRSTGLPPTPQMAYLDHWLGPSGASEFHRALKERPNTSVASVITGSPYTKNRGLVEKNGRPMSVAETYNNLGSLLDRKGVEFGVQEPLGGGISGGFTSNAIRETTRPLDNAIADMLEKKKAKTQSKKPFDTSSKLADTKPKQTKTPKGTQTDKSVASNDVHGNVLNNHNNNIFNNTTEIHQNVRIKDTKIEDRIMAGRNANASAMA